MFLVFAKYVSDKFQSGKLQFGNIFDEKRSHTQRRDVQNGGVGEKLDADELSEERDHLSDLVVEGEDVLVPHGMRVRSFLLHGADVSGLTLRHLLVDRIV